MYNYLYMYIYIYIYIYVYICIISHFLSPYTQSLLEVKPTYLDLICNLH